MTVAEEAYLAGIFDGEGNVHIHLHKNHSKQTISYSLRIGIGSTDTAWLSRLHEKWAVGCLVLQTIRQKAHHKPYANWVTSGEQAKYLLRTMLPYLQIKKERAELALQFEFAGRGNRAPHEERSRIWAQMRELNRKGIVPPDSIAGAVL